MQIGIYISITSLGRNHHENMPKPHFYIVKLGFTEVYIFSYFCSRNIECGYSLEPPCWGGSNEYPQSMFLANVKISDFFYQKIFSFWK